MDTLPIAPTHRTPASPHLADLVAAWAKRFGLSRAAAGVELSTLAAAGGWPPPDEGSLAGLTWLGGTAAAGVVRLSRSATDAGTPGAGSELPASALAPAPRLTGRRAVPAPAGAHPALLTPPAGSDEGARAIVVRRYALTSDADQQRWLRHAEATEAAVAASLPPLGAPVPALLGRLAGAVPGVRLLIQADAGQITLAQALAAAPETARADLLLWAVEALEALHHAGTAASRPLRRRLKAEGDDLWRWQAATRGEELIWHAERSLATLGVVPNRAARRTLAEGLLALADWAAGLAGTLCHGRCHPTQIVLGEGGPSFVGWQEAHWGMPEHDLATLDCAVALPPEAFDRYCERRGILRRALFREAFARCRLIAEIESLGRAVPRAVGSEVAQTAFRARAAAARARLVDDPLTWPFANLLP